MLLIGRFLGATTLGFYALAYRLVLYPLQGVSSVVGRVMFPLLSRIQQDDARIRNAYLKVTNAVAMVIGEGNAVVLTEAALGQVNIFNTVEGIETVKIDMIVASINNNDGIVSVNQSVGNMNNQGSAIAFGALTTTATIGVPGT